MSLVASFKLGTLVRPLVDKTEEGGDDVKSAWPLRPGQHTYYNGSYRASQTRERELIAEKLSQFGLESATRLHEVGIASNRGSARRGEYVPGPCTHRPSRHGSWQYPKSMIQSRFAGKEVAEGKADDWGEVVTRSPYRKVRLDHLLSKASISYPPVYSL